MADNMADQIRAQNRRMEEELADLSERLEALRHRFDRYFMGLERIPPLKDRDTLHRDVRNSSLRKSHKTVLRFQFNNLRQRMTTYNRYWERIMRMIEEGTFKREKNALGTMPMPAVPVAEPLAARDRRAEAPDPMRSVFDSWVQAQQSVGKGGSVDFDRFRSKLEEQKRAQMQKYGWKDVDYSVKVKDGKVALVARPVKDEG